MKDESISFLNFVTNLLVFVLIIYMFKTIAGINLVAGCHAEEVLTATCTANNLNGKKSEHQLN